eukprot:Rmarinus@m.24502
MAWYSIRACVAQADRSLDPDFLRSHSTVDVYLRVRRWLSSEKNVRGIIFLSHGVHEHLGRYEEVARFFNEKGFHVFGHDHIGHGLSGGTRGDIKHINLLVDDVLHHSEIIKKSYPNLPLFLLGHSMGAMIAILAALKRKNLYSGCILSGPAIIPDPATATPIAVSMAKICATVLPYLPVARVNRDFLTHCPEMREKHRLDPLINHSAVTARTAYSLLQGMDIVKGFAADVDFPYLIIQGTEDRLTNQDGATLLHTQSKSRDKKLIMYDGFFHELFNEPLRDRQRVYRDVAEWLDARA